MDVLIRWTVGIVSPWERQEGWGSRDLVLRCRVSLLSGPQSGGVGTQELRAAPACSGQSPTRQRSPAPAAALGEERAVRAARPGCLRAQDALGGQYIQSACNWGTTLTGTPAGRRIYHGRCGVSTLHAPGGQPLLDAGFITALRCVHTARTGGTTPAGHRIYHGRCGVSTLHAPGERPLLDAGFITAAAGCPHCTHRGNDPCWTQDSSRPLRGVHTAHTGGTTPAGHRIYHGRCGVSTLHALGERPLLDTGFITAAAGCPHCTHREDNMTESGVETGTGPRLRAPPLSAWNRPSRRGPGGGVSERSLCPPLWGWAKGQITDFCDKHCPSTRRSHQLSSRSVRVCSLGSHVAPRRGKGRPFSGHAACEMPRGCAARPRPRPA
ncbi:uncharacterized protein [Saccopteryx bilineata]|uniref:uncharacterized protein n=1 Tax=Saccopteryx bilineata TaxID=59482 RepID=UPI00338E6AFD